MVSIWQLLLLSIVFLLLFNSNGKKVSKLMHDIGSGFRAFKAGLNGKSIDDEQHTEL